ncbi:hypothetical protein [Streptomyces cyaneogriseus]|nr:hypothetical protein [Streptomyces cyaneogriseus]
MTGLSGRRGGRTAYDATAAGLPPVDDFARRVARTVPAGIG